MLFRSCEIALEEALRIKEQQGGAEVVLVSIGPKVTQEQLRTGLAMGADRAMLVVAEEDLDPATAAAVLKKIVEAESPELVMAGKQSIDDDANQVGQVLASSLDWPQATFASKVQIAGERAVVAREIDGGLETLELKLPAVITTDLRLNEPRYVTLPNIMKAKKKPLEMIKAADLGIDIAPRTVALRVSEPAVRKAGIKVADTAELVKRLKEEAKVI